MKTYVRDPSEIIKQGGSVCCLCKKHIDMIHSDSDDEGDIEGGSILKDIKTETGKVKRGVKKASKKVGKYVTSTQSDNGLASDLITYGIPATTAALLGTPAGLLGGPVAGVAASAVGSKLGSLASEKIKKETLKEGNGMKRTARFAKGSQEAKDHMKMLRDRKKK